MAVVLSVRGPDGNVTVLRNMVRDQAVLTPPLSGRAAHSRSRGRVVEPGRSPVDPGPPDLPRHGRGQGGPAWPEWPPTWPKRGPTSTASRPGSATSPKPRSHVP